MAVDGIPVVAGFCWTAAVDFATVFRVTKLLGALALAAVTLLAPSDVSGQASSAGLVVYGDVVYFYPPGTPTQLPPQQPVQARRAGRLPDDRDQSGDRQARSRDTNSSST